MEPRKLFRSSRNKMISGVCAGLAEYLNIDITVTRVLYVILSCCTAFAGVLAYIIFTLVIPSDDTYIQY